MILNHFYLLECDRFRKNITSNENLEINSSKEIEECLDSNKLNEKDEDIFEFNFSAKNEQENEDTVSIKTERFL